MLHDFYDNNHHTTSLVQLLEISILPIYTSINHHKQKRKY